MKPEIVSYDGKWLSQISEIENLSFSCPWSEESLRQSGEHSSSIFSIALYGEIVAGYGCILLVEEEGELVNIAVSPVYRSQGVGQALMDALLDGAVQRGGRTIFLEVRQSNMPARHLYEKNGFVSMGIRKKYYRKPVEDAVVMCCHLPVDNE